jgi:hypothetical protein
MEQPFAVGDRVIVIDARVAGVPQGTVGIVVQVFAQWLGVCDVLFDGRVERRAVLKSALAPAPRSDSPPVKL